MKRRVFLGALAWSLLISVAHVQLNVGWSTLGKTFRVFTGTERRELVVGFLPVT